MNLKDSINQFYFDMTIGELRQLNRQAIGKAISYNSVMYLDIISFKENCTVSFLADALHISKSAVTMKIGELVRQGLVLKTQSEQDKRVFYLSVNDAVIQANESYDRPICEAIEKIEKEYSPEKIAAFCKILNVFGKAFSQETKLYGTQSNF